MNHQEQDKQDIIILLTDIKKHHPWMKESTLRNMRFQVKYEPDPVKRRQIEKIIYKVNGRILVNLTELNKYLATPEYAV